MLDVRSILVFSEDPKRLADFYRQVFRKDPDWSEGGYSGFLVGKGFITIAHMTKSVARTRNPNG